MKTTQDILLGILRTMDIPEARRNINDPNNLRWLLRNIRINNNEHQDIERAIGLIKLHIPAITGE